MNIIIGKSGQVACSLAREFSKKNLPFLHTSSKSDDELSMDLGEPASIMACFDALDKRGLKQAKVYLPGALTNVDRCEKEQELCKRINMQGPLLVGKECKKRGWPLLFFSTEYVFGQSEYEGGAIGPFSEEAEVSPCSYYGLCKWEAEQELMQLALPQLLIVRTTMVFSYDRFGMNFFMQLYRHLDRLEEGETGLPIFKIAVDQISTPCFADSLAKNSRTLMDKGKSGIFNLVGADLLSREVLLKKIIHSFGFTESKVLPGFSFMKTKDLGQVALRPLHAGLTSDKARAHGLEVLSLEEAFQAIKQQMQC